jgi:Predicted UDP-glucose 6-dehydrogenase
VDALGYDPAAMPNATRMLGDSVRLSESLAEAVSAADVIVLATAWEEFKNIDAALLERDGRRRVVVDCWRVLPAEEIEQIADYVVLGKGGVSREAVAQD